MTFLQLQQEFADLHMDTSATWIVGGTQNKNCINKAYEYMYDILKNSEKIKKYLGITKVKVIFTNKVGTLPADFDVISKVSTVDILTDSDADYNNFNRYYDFVVKGAIGNKTMILEYDYDELRITYVPILTLLSTDSDKPVLPTEIQRCITDFAMVEYNRRIRDSVEASNSLMLAQGILNQKMKTLG